MEKKSQVTTLILRGIRRLDWIDFENKTFNSIISVLLIYHPIGLV